jgi:hypothetical protein
MPTVNYAPYPVLRFYDNNNVPLVGGKVYTYFAGGNTLVQTYQNPTGTTTNTNPIILDSRGECLIYLQPGISYKFTVQDSSGSLIRTTDNISTFAAITGAGNNLISAADVSAQRSILGINGSSNRNRIINGDFSVSQFAVSGVTSGNPVYFTDNWFATSTNPGAASQVQFQKFPVFGLNALTASAMSDILSSGNYLRVVTNNYGTVVNEIGVKIENVASLSGKTVTFSFYGMASGGVVNANWVATQSFGTGGSPSSDVSVYAGGSFSIGNASFSRYTTTFTIPSIYGKTLGSNNNDYFYVGVSFTPVFFYNYFAGFQLEEGSIPTNFEVIPYAQQLLNCQRYYNYYGGDTGPSPVGIAYSTTNVTHPIVFPVKMRATPTFTTGQFSVGGSNIGTMVARDITNAGATIYNSAGNFTIGTYVLAQANFDARI